MSHRHSRVWSRFEQASDAAMAFLSGTGPTVPRGALDVAVVMTAVTVVIATGVVQEAALSVTTSPTVLAETPEHITRAVPD